MLYKSPCPYIHQRVFSALLLMYVVILVHVLGMGVDRSIMSMGGRDSTIQWAPSSRSTMLPHLSRGKGSFHEKGYVYSGQ